MSTPIDELTIEIDAKANDANNAIESLCKKIDILTTSISKVDVGKLNSLGNGIKRLGDSLQTMKSVDARSISSVVGKINSLSAIDTSKFATVSANLHQMANGIQSLGTVSANVASVGELAKNISKLGNKSVQAAVTNIPQLATALNGLMTSLAGAPKVSQNVIQMTNALANLTAQGSKVGSASSSIVKGLNRASSSATRANKSFKGLAFAFGTFYANCFMVIRGVKALWKSINSTADYLEAFNYFEVALNKVGGDWAGDWEKYSEKLGVTSAEEYANSFKTRLNESLKGLSGVQISIDANGETGLLTDTGLKNLGLNIQEVTQYASQLASVTNSVGQTGEVTLATASAFTKLGADMSSLFNMDYSSVMNNLQSGLIGQSRALYKYGIDITNATLQTYAYELGVEKAVSEMTQAEKMQLRMIAILDQSRVSWGDQANTINSLSNSIRQFKNNISEAGQILGQLFVPIMSKLMPIVNGVTIAIKRLMVSVAGITGVKLDLSEFGQGTSNITDDMDGLGDSLDGVAESAEKAKKGIRGFDELNVINTSSDSGNGSSDIGDNIDLTQQILSATAEYEKAWKEAYDRMQNRAEEFADKIAKALEPVKKIFEDFAVGDFFQTGQDVSNLIVSITDFFARAIDSVDWEDIGNKIGGFLAGIDWFKVFKSVGNLMWQGLKAAFELAIGIFDSVPLETALISLAAMPKLIKVITASKFVTGFKKLSKAIKPVFDTFVSFKKGTGSTLIATLGATETGVISLRNNLTELQKGAITAIAGFAEFSIVSKSVEKIAKGSGNLVAEIAKIGTTAGIAGAALTAVLGFPTGVAAAGILGLIGAIKGLSDAEKYLIEQSEIENYGNTISNIVSAIAESSSAIKERANTALEYVNNAGIAEMSLASDLSNRYFDLAEKESLSNEEKAEMQYLAQKMVETIPSLEAYYNTETGLIDATRQSVENLINTRLQEIQISAAEDKLTEAYENRIEAIDNLTAALEPAQSATENYNRLSAEFENLTEKVAASEKYAKLGQSIRESRQDTTALVEEQEKLWKILSEGGTKEVQSLTEYRNQLLEVSKELSNAETNYNAFNNALLEAYSAYDTANENVEKFTEMYVSGMQSAGENGAEGFAKGLNSGTEIVEEANELLMNAGMLSATEALDEHSPSKKYEEFGKYSVEGYNLGFSKNQNTTLSVISTFVQNSLDKFRELIAPMHDIGVNVMQGLCDGLLNMENTLYEKVQSIADNIADTVKTALDIHSPSRVMAELGEYTIAGFKEGMENLYKPTLESLKGFSYNVEIAPVPSLASMYESYQSDYANAYTSSYSDAGYLGAVSQQSNTETNALLREVLNELRKGQTIEFDDGVIAGRTRKIANNYTRLQGKPYFDY